MTWNRDSKGRLLIFALWPLALGVFLFGVLARAQTPANASRLLRNAAERVTVKGTIEKVLQHACSTPLLPSRGKNVHASRCAELVLSTKDGLVNLLLGPASFIRNNRFFFVNGDQVVATGFRAASVRRPDVVAEEVVTSKRALALRDSNGRPLWKEHDQNEAAKHGVSQAVGQSSRKPLTSTFYHLSSSKIATNPETSEVQKEKPNAK